MARIRNFLRNIQFMLFASSSDLPAASTMGEGVALADNVLYLCNGSTYKRLTGNIYEGEGTPEAAVVAAIGSLYLRTNGGANTTLYVKESGAGNTGWVAK